MVCACQTVAAGISRVFAPDKFPGDPSVLILDEVLERLRVGNMPYAIYANQVLLLTLALSCFLNGCAGISYLLH